MTIELTEEQKSCVEHPLDKQILIIDADPGTGKTEILNHRVRFICQQNEKQRKFILVLAVGRNISKSIKRKLKAQGLKKIHDKLKKVLPEFQLKHEQCERECCQEPIIVSCTIHSIAYWIIHQIFAKQFKEKRKIKILTSNQNKEVIFTYKNKEYSSINEKIHWTIKETILKERKIFSYLLNKLPKEEINKQERRKLWKIFKQTIKLKRGLSPYYHWIIENYPEFLVEVEKIFPENKLNIYYQLKNICSWDKENNLWLTFDDIIENALLFSASQVKGDDWPVFDYILVDECQDLKQSLLKLVTEVLSHPQSNFTFVGDPKQNIMAFAGATADTFELLTKRFPNCSQMGISVSFRVPQEIAAMANDFTSKFMPYKPKLKTIKNNGGQKPVIFVAGLKNNYQLIPQEEIAISEKAWQIYEGEISESNKKEKKIQRLKEKLRKELIKEKKLEKQMNFILQQINKLDKKASKVILFRKNEIGNWIYNWFIETKYYDFTTTGNTISKLVGKIIHQIKDQLRNKEFSLTKFKSINDFLISLGINWENVPQLQPIIDNFDQQRNLDEEEDYFLNKEEVKEFILEIDKQLIEKDIEDNGKTVLSTIHRAKGLEFDYVFVVAVDEEILPSKIKGKEPYWIREEINLFYTAITRAKKGLYLTISCQEDCSRFLRNLDFSLVEIIPDDWKLLPINKDKEQINSSSFPKSIAELFGEKGEEEAFELLSNNKKINDKLQELTRNWEEIEDLQIDIYAETQRNVYFIEVKSWSENFYHSPKEGLIYQQEIINQQIRRQAKIAQNFVSEKEIIYLVSFLTGEIANDFKNLLAKQEINDLQVVHHDKVYGKVWASEYNLPRIDEFVYEREKNERQRKTKKV